MKKLVAAAMSLLIGGMVSGHVAAADTIKVGAILPMTGNIASFGKSSAQAIRMAFDQVNKAGGIKGKDLELVVVDSANDPAQSANAANRLIAQEKVVAIIGDVASSCTLASAPIAQASGIPMISPTSTNVKVTQVGNYIFRACFIDDFQGEVLANFAFKNLKLKKVAVFTAVDSDYSKGLAKFFMARYKKLGGAITAQESYQQGDSDFSAQLTKIKATRPEAIYVPGYYGEVGNIARQASQLGLKVPLLGGDGFDAPQLYGIAGDAIVGSYFSNHYSKDSATKVAKEFLAEYTKRYKEDPDALAALGYGAAMIVAEAIGKASKVTGEAIRLAMVKTKYAGVSGSVTFDADRNPVKGAVVLKVEKGEGNYKWVATVEP